MPTIERLLSASETVARELAALGSVLHGDTRTLSTEQLERIVEDRNIILMVVKDSGKIIGMATLYILPKIGKCNGIIEDVIVDEKYRGQGLGEKLVRALLEEGKRVGVQSVSLTSRSHRVAAHKLYLKLGFSIQETNVFKLSL
jgi:ribosomal protein S18 acetylase RimI-like enzyme